MDFDGSVVAGCGLVSLEAGTDVSTNGQNQAGD